MTLVHEPARLHREEIMVEICIVSTSRKGERQRTTRQGKCQVVEERFALFLLEGSNWTRAPVGVVWSNVYYIFVIDVISFAKSDVDALLA